MSAASFRLGLVGCGRLAEAGYVPAIAAAGGVTLAGIADPDAGRRRSLAALITTTAIGPPDGAEVRAFADAVALVAGGEVDGLIVASPASAHVTDAVEAAAAGIPTLVEKPPALDGDQAALLAALDPPPWVGFNRRFDPGAARVRAAVRAAVRAGEPLDLVLEIGYRRAGWAPHAVRDDALLDLGPHLVDWARWVGGADVVSVDRAELGSERVAVDLTLGGGRGRARLRAATDRPHAELVEVRDPGGRVVARHRVGGLAAAVRGRLGRAAPSLLVATLAAQVAAFVAAARASAFADGAAGVPEAAADGGAGPLGTAADGLAAMRVIDAVRACAAGGHPTPLTTPEVR